jgi:hypothetical protein
MGKGRISLYSWDGVMLRSNRYDSVRDRKAIIDMWHSQYKGNIRFGYVQVLPDTEELKVSHNGLNKLKRVDMSDKPKDKKSPHPLDPLRKANPVKAEMIYFRRGNSNRI